MSASVQTTVKSRKSRAARKSHSLQFKRIGSRKALAGRDDITLSQPSKMPCYGWSLPAGKACPASKGTVIRFGDAAVCSSCYAMGGNYLYPNVKAALDGRFQFVLDSLKADNGDTFVRTMVEMITRAVDSQGNHYFRIHDSGDFFHPMYVECWARIAEALPNVRFWAPTREWLRPMMLPFLAKLAALPNVVIRPSGEAIDQDAPVVPGLAAGSMVASKRTLPTLQAEGRKVCPATTTDKPQCAAHGCTHCWDNPSEPAIYAMH